MDESLQKLRQEVRAGDVSRLPALILESGRVSRSLYEFLPRIIANKDDLLVCDAVEQTNLCAIRQSYNTIFDEFDEEKYPGRRYCRARELAFIHLFDNVLVEHQLTADGTLVNYRGNPVKIDEVMLVQGEMLYFTARAWMDQSVEHCTQFYPATCDLESVVQKESVLPFEQKSVLRLGTYPTPFDLQNPNGPRIGFDGDLSIKDLSEFLFGNLSDALEHVITPHPQSPRYQGEFSFISNIPGMGYPQSNIGIQNIGTLLVLQDLPQVCVTISGAQRKLFAREE